MKERDEGSILKLSPHGEYGLIIVWCTKDHGIIHTAARHARKPGSDLAGRIDLFHECELVYTPPKQGDLATLSSASLISPRLPLRSDLRRLRLASHMARLLISTVEPGSREENWHGLISKALDYTASSSPRKAVLLHFEKRLAELHGLYTPAIPAYHALLQHFHHLPAGRNELLASLP